jgi:DNA modification methylase
MTLSAISDVMDWEQSPSLLHPNQKPLGAGAKLIATYSNREAHILDPFCGSGTTLLAARNLGCRAVGIEIGSVFAKLPQINWTFSRLDAANVFHPQLQLFKRSRH